MLRFRGRAVLSLIFIQTQTTEPYQLTRKYLKMIGLVI